MRRMTKMVLSAAAILLPFLLCTQYGYSQSAKPVLGIGGGSSAGSGVATITSSCGLTSSGTTAIAIQRSLTLNAQTGTSYAIVTGDCGKLVSFSNASATAVTIAQAGTTGFATAWFTDVVNLGAGAVTITPTTSTIGGGATLVLAQYQGARIVSNGTNYLIPYAKGTSSTTTATAFTKGLLAALPATCAVGDLYWATDATTTAGLGNLYYCTATNTQTQIGYTAAGDGTITVTQVAPGKYTLGVTAGSLLPTTLATQAADTMLMNATGGTASPTAVPLSNCITPYAAESYNTGTHAKGCNTFGAAFATQTDGATITWAIGSILFSSAAVTLGGNRTLNITGPVNGGSYVLRVIQDGTGGRTLTLGTGCTWKVSGGGAGAITPTATAAAIDILAFTYDGTNCYATFAKNFN